MNFVRKISQLGKQSRKYYVEVMVGEAKNLVGIPLKEGLMVSIERNRKIYNTPVVFLENEEAAFNFAINFTSTCFIEDNENKNGTKFLEKLYNLYIQASDSSSTKIYYSGSFDIAQLITENNGNSVDMSKKILLAQSGIANNVNQNAIINSDNSPNIKLMFRVSSSKNVRNDRSRLSMGSITMSVQRKKSYSPTSLIYTPTPSPSHCKTFSRSFDYTGTKSSLRRESSQKCAAEVFSDLLKVPNTKRVLKSNTESHEDLPFNVRKTTLTSEDVEVLQAAKFSLEETQKTVFSDLSLHTDFLYTAAEFDKSNIPKYSGIKSKSPSADSLNIALDNVIRSGRRSF